MENKNQSQVVLLNCGGTIAMIEDEKGQLSLPNEDIVRIYLESNNNFGLNINYINNELRMDSSQINHEHWATIVRALLPILQSAISRNLTGIVITHGTDTLAYTAAAITFALPHLNVPIILTASQYPLKAQYNDARNNIYGACIIASTLRCPEVMVFMNGLLMRGTRVQKLNASDIDSFSSPTIERIGVFRDKLHYDQFFVRRIMYGRIEKAFFKDTTFRQEIICALEGKHQEQAQNFRNEWIDKNGSNITQEEKKRNKNVFRKTIIPIINPEWSIYGIPDQNEFSNLFSLLLKIQQTKNEFAKCALFYLYPGNPHLLKHSLETLFNDNSIKGILFVCYGAGNAPKEITDLIKEKWGDWQTNSRPHFPLLAACSMCTSGFVKATYNASILVERKFNNGNKRIVACCNDITIEAAFAKISICSRTLADTNTPNALNSFFRGIEKMESSLRGELTIVEQ